MKISPSTRSGTLVDSIAIDVYWRAIQMKLNISCFIKSKYKLIGENKLFTFQFDNPSCP